MGKFYAHEKLIDLFTFWASTNKWDYHRSTLLVIDISFPKFSNQFTLLIIRADNQGLPAEMGIALTFGFATIGLLSQQTQKITDAQKARGYDVQPKNLVRRVQVLTALLLLIFLATLERSLDISIAILARGFEYNISVRTYGRQLKFQRIDYIAMGIFLSYYSVHWC